MLDERNMELLRALFREEGERIDKMFQEQEERMEEAEADIQVLKTSVRILSEDVRALKKAQ